MTMDLGRSRDGLYEPVLADSEREAVADLLQYLENVRGVSSFSRVDLADETTSASRHRLLLWRTTSRPQHPRVFGQR